MNRSRVILLALIASIITAILIISSCAQGHVSKNYADVESLDEAYCADLPDPADMNDCYGYLAKRDGNVEFCHSIDSTQDKAQCIYDVAKKTEDKSLCDDITIYSYKTKCQNEFA